MGAKNRCAIVTRLLFVFLLLENCCDVNAGRVSGGSGRRSGGGTSHTNSGHVTKPSYNPSNNAGNSNHELTKLSYPSNNAQPGGVGGSNIGWTAPKQQGPPPAYSASNPVGGAKTNVHEQPPAYHPPPSYGGNVHTPITATNTHSVQSSYPQQQHAPAGATYYPAGHAPAGATYYPAGQAPPGATYYPGGHAPAGTNYYPGGHMPAGGNYYPHNQGMPQGATYLPAGAALPPGATYYSSPPQSSSSGLGFGSGLAAGAIGGAILGHALTPTQTRVVEQAPANGGHSNDDRVIIINNGPPGSVQTSQTGSGTTVITTGQQPAETNAIPPAAVAGGAAAAAAVPLVPMVAAGSNDNSTAAPIPGAPPAPELPPAGGIVCMPVRFNETDPNDATKMIEVEKTACYPAPQPEAPPAVQPVATDTNTGVPLAPMNPVPVPGQTSQQMQQNPTMVQTSSNSAVAYKNIKSSFMMSSVALSLLLAFCFN